MFQLSYEEIVSLIHFGAVFSLHCKLWHSIVRKEDRPLISCSLSLGKGCDAVPASNERAGDHQDKPTLSRAVVCSLKLFVPEGLSAGAAHIIFTTVAAWLVPL